MFVLDARIEKDSNLIFDLPLCQVRLQNDSRYPWLVLVPKVEGATEVHELTEEQQTKLMKESSLVANCLKKVTQCKKINVANLGNVVSQLHWHVVARFEEDKTWPGPIWGVGEVIPYEDKKRAELADSLIKLINEN